MQSHRKRGREDLTAISGSSAGASAYSATDSKALQGSSSGSRMRMDTGSPAPAVEFSSPAAQASVASSAAEAWQRARAAEAAASPAPHDLAIRLRFSGVTFDNGDRLWSSAERHGPDGHSPPPPLHREASKRARNLHRDPHPDPADRRLLCAVAARRRMLAGFPPAQQLLEEVQRRRSPTFALPQPRAPSPPRAPERANDEL